MSSVPHGLAGTSTSGAATTLTAVDTTQSAPAENTTARDVQPAASVAGTPNILLGDASTVRIRTVAGFFKVIGDCLYFPWGQRLCSAAVRAAGIAQPAWFLQSLLAQLGSLHALFSPGLFASLQQAGAVVGRFVQGYFIGPGTITAVGSILERLNPGTYLSPAALLTLAGSVAAILHRHFTEVLSAQIVQAGAVVGRFIQGFFLTPNALIVAAAQIVGHRVPALSSMLPLHGVVVGLYHRGRQFFATERLTAILMRGPAQGRAGTLHAAGALRRTVTPALAAAELRLTAALQAGSGFFGAFSALLEPATVFEVLRTRFLAATEQASGVLGPAQIVAARSALLTVSGTLRRAIVGAGYSASLPLQALLQAGRVFSTALTSSSTLSGAVATARTVLRLLNATLQAAAALGPAQVGKRLAASMALSSATGRAIDVARAATLVATAVLAKVLSLARAVFASTLTLAGSVVGTLVRLLAATLEASAALGPTTVSKLRASALSVAPALLRTVDVVRAAALDVSAALIKDLAGLARTAFVAALGLVASLETLRVRLLAATLEALGVLGPQQIDKRASSTLAPAPSSTHGMSVLRQAELVVAAVMTQALADPEIDSATLEILYDSATGEELFETSGP